MATAPPDTSMLEFDLLLTSAIVLTMNPAQPVLRDASIGIRAGRIAWIDAGLPRAYTAARTIELPGHFVMPGFINPHSHAILSMVRGVAMDLGFAPSYTPGIPKGTQVTERQACALARLGALEALLFGSTLLGDNFVHAGVTTHAMAELGLRLCPSWRIHDVDFASVANGRWDHQAAIGDQTLGAAIALHEEWRNHPRVRVNLAAHAADTCSDGFLREVAAASRQHGLRVSTHLGQSQVEVDRVRERTGKSSTEVFDEAGLLNDHLMGGHCIYLSDADIERMAKSGAHAVHIPKCNAASGRLAPTHKLKRAGVNIALATDTQHADMIELMRWALVTARVQTGKVDDEWQPRHVFEMATMGGAKAVGMAAELGSIEIGKCADLVICNANRPHLTPHVNPIGALVHNGQGRDVTMVIVDGEVLVEDGRPTRVDLETVCREAEEASRELWGDVGVRYWENHERSA